MLHNGEQIIDFRAIQCYCVSHFRPAAWRGGKVLPVRFYNAEGRRLPHAFDLAFREHQFSMEEALGIYFDQNRQKRRTLATKCDAYP